MLRQQQLVVPSISLSTDTIAAVRRQIQGCETCSTQVTVRLGELVMRLIGWRNPDEDCVISEDICCPHCISVLDLDTFIAVQTGQAASAAMAAT